MLKKIFKILIISVFINTGFAQNYKKITFYFSKTNIVGGYSVKLNSKPNYYGIFIDNIDYKIKSNKGIFEFNIYPEGYQQIKYICRIDTLNQENKIRFTLKEKSIELDEVIVSIKRNRFSKNGDTINVFVEDIKTKPHAEASELFDRIEGFENNDNGSYKIFGSTVDIVMIDGKRIFGGNPALTLSNINADMIKSIDIIENNSRIGNKKKVINLKLKSDKKAGIYGNIGIGRGTNNAYDLNFKANKLLNTGIFSSFGTSNNISLFKIKILNDNELVEEFYEKNTFFGYQNKSETIQNLREDDEINAGIFRDNSIGTSLNFNNKKTSQSINIILGKSNQTYLSNISGTTTSENKSIKSLNSSNGVITRISSNISYGINKKFGEANSLIFKVESQINDVKKAHNDSLYYNDGVVENYRLLKSFRKNDENCLKLDFGTSFNYKNNRAKTLFYSKILLNNQNNSNSVTTNPNMVIQKLTNISFISEVVQSYPISKKILIEHRPFLSFNSSQFNNKFIGNTAEQTTQNLFRLDNWVYFQQGKVLINVDLSFFYYNILNKNLKPNSKKTIRFRKINIKFPKNEVLTNFDFNYENDLMLPLNLEQIAIPDSLNFYFRQRGNNTLNPFFSRKLSVGYTNTNISFINLISTFDWKIEDNSIQNDSYYTDNLLFVNSRSNITKSLSSLNSNTFISIKKLPKKMDISLNHIFSLGQSYGFFNSQPVSGRSNLHIFNFQTIIRGTNAFSIKNVLSGTYTSFQNLKTKNFENILKINLNIKNELFSKITFKTIFGSSIPFQPLLNLEFQKFILKNKIGLEVKAINLLNVKNNSIINQSLYQQFITQNNNIPRIFILKVSFYPEKWK